VELFYDFLWLSMQSVIKRIILGFVPAR